MLKLMAPLWEIHCISDFLLASRGLQVNKPAITSRATEQKYFLSMLGLEVAQHGGR